MKKMMMILLILFSLLLAACGGSSAPAETAVEQPQVASQDTTAEASAEEPMTDEPMADETMDEEPMAEEMAEEMADEPMAEEPMDEEPMDEETAVATGPAFLTAELTDARTGDTFTLADFAGQTVYVEPMATWCTNCRRQLGRVAEANAQLEAGEVIFIGLSVEANLSDEVLAGYANGQGFDFLFAVATPELLEGLVEQYGRSVANPPATPHFLISPDGTLSDLFTGSHSVDEILMFVDEASQ